MSKRRERIIILIWLLVTTAIRVLYYLLDYTGVTDPYGFYDSAILCAEQGEYYTASGLGFAYTNAITTFIRWIGFDMTIIFIWQLLMEIVSLLFIVLAAKNFWGIYSAVIIGCLLSASPILLVFLKICSPEEYFLLHAGFLFFVLSIFYAYSRKKSWFRSTVGELGILLMGIYIGMLCIWNYLGFAAYFAIFFIVIKNYRIIRDKSHLMQLTDGDMIEEKDQIMNVFVQMFMIILGTTIGAFFTLIKYTGYSGYTITEQLAWWAAQFKTLPDRTMDFDTFFAMYLILSVVVGSAAGAIVHKLKKPLKSKIQKAEEEEMEKSENYDLGSRRPTYFITEDGKKVDYLENPLAEPPRHEHKELKFDLDELGKQSSDLVLFDETTDINYDNLRKSILDVENVNPGVRFVERKEERPEEKKKRLEQEKEAKKPDAFKKPEAFKAPDNPLTKEDRAQAIKAALYEASEKDALASPTASLKPVTKKGDDTDKPGESVSKTDAGPVSTISAPFRPDGPGAETVLPPADGGQKTDMANPAGSGINNNVTKPADLSSSAGAKSGDKDRPSLRINDSEPGKDFTPPPNTVINLSSDDDFLIPPRELQKLREDDFSFEPHEIKKAPKDDFDLDVTATDDFDW